MLTEPETAFVHAERVARLATLRVDGSPHIVPICYAFDGKLFFTPLDEKPKRVRDGELQRIRNIRAHPEVGLLIDRYDEDWSRLGYVLIRGHARLIEPDSPAHAGVVALLRERYPQYRTMKLEAHQIIEVTPVHVTSWGPAIGS